MLGFKISIPEQRRVRVIEEANTGERARRGVLVQEVTKGEWDVEVRNLTRVFYLDRRLRGSLLDPAVRDHLFNDLLALDGEPDSDTYSLYSCGNQDESTGSPADRANENSWLEKG